MALAPKPSTLPGLTETQAADVLDQGKPAEVNIPREGWTPPMKKPTAGFERPIDKFTIKPRPRPESKHLLKGADLSDPIDAKVYVAHYLNSKFGSDQDAILRDYEGETVDFKLSGNPITDAAAISTGQVKAAERASTVISKGLQKLRPAEPSGSIENFTRSIASGMAKVIPEAVGTAGTLMAEFVSSQESAGITMGMGGRATYTPKKDRRTSAEITEGRREVQGIIKEWTFDISDMSGEAFGVDEGRISADLGGVVGQLPATVISGGLAMAPLAFGEMLRDSEQTFGRDFADIPNEDRAKIMVSGAAYSLFTMASEKIGLKAMGLNKLDDFFKGGKKIKGSTFKRVLAGGLGEGGTELVQAASKDQFAKLFDPGRMVGWDDVKGYLYEGALGMIVGTPMSAVTATTENAFSEGAEERFSFRRAGIAGHDLASMTETDNALGKWFNPVDGMTSEDMAASLSAIAEEDFDEWNESTHGEAVAENGELLKDLAARARQGDESAANEYVAATTVEASQSSVEAGLDAEEAEIRGAQPEQVDDGDARPDDVLAAQAREESRAEREGLLIKQAEEEIAKDESEEVADIIEHFETRSRGGVTTKHMPSIRKGGAALIDQMRRSGMSKEEIAAESLRIMTEAGDPTGDLKKQVVEGEQTANSKAGNDFRATVKLYKDADPLAVAEEYAHAETDREINEGTINYEEIAQWREQVEAATSGEDVRAKALEDPDITEEQRNRNHKEWIAEQVKARLAGKMTDVRLPPTFARFLNRMMARLKSLFTRANELIELEAAGMLPEGFVETLDRLGSMDDDVLMQNVRAEQAAEVALDPKDELRAVLRSEKIYIPTPAAAPEHSSSLELIRESLGGSWASMASKYSTLDSMVESLQNAGFSSIKTEGDILGALSNMVAGETLYANPESRSAAQAHADESFSLGGAEVTPDANAQGFPSEDGGVFGPASFSLRGFHGSPHVGIRKMSSDKIGTGEGAQAYGYGLYIAQAEEVGKGYRKNLAQMPDNVSVNTDPAGWVEMQLFSGISESDIVDGLDILDAPSSALEEGKARAADRADAGSLYQVELNAEQDELLDWDKPLSEQSDKVKAALNTFTELVAPDGVTTDDRLGADLLMNLQDAMPDEMAGFGLKESDYSDRNKAFSMHLSSLGIKGIRYLDGSSRTGGQTPYGVRWKGDDPVNGDGAEVFDRSTGKVIETFDTFEEADSWVDSKREGTSNYVVFNDADITVTHENGEAVELPAKAPSYSLAPQEQTASEIISLAKEIDADAFNKKVKSNMDFVESERAKGMPYSLEMEADQITLAAESVLLDNTEDPRAVKMLEGYGENQFDKYFSMKPEENFDDLITERAEEIETRTPERQAFIDYQREVRMTDGDNTKVQKAKLKELHRLAKEADEEDKLRQSGNKKIADLVAKKTRKIRAQALERAEVTEAVKELERLINSPDVPKEVRARMRGYGRLAERTTAQGKARWIEQMTNKLDAEMLKHTRTQNVRTLRSLLRPFATEYSPNRMKLKKRVGETARSELNYAGRLMNNAEAVPPAGITDERRNELIDIFADTGSRQSNPTRVKEALDTAGAILRGGRTARDEFKQDRMDRNEALGKMVQDVVLNKERPKGEDTITAGEKKRGKVQKTLNDMSAMLVRPMEGFQQQLNKLDRLKDGELENLFLGATFQADQKEISLNAENTERTNKDFETILGDDNRQAAAWYRDSTKYHETDIEWMDSKEAGMEKRTITKQQGVSLLMQWLDPSLRSTFANMGINEETMVEVREFIGKQGVSMAHYLRSRYAEQGVALQAKFIETEGVPLDIIDGYGGRARRVNSKGAKQEDMQMFATGPNGRPTVKSGSMKERTNSTDFLIFNDAMRDFTQHTREVNHFISHAALAKDLQAAFITQKPAELAIRQKYGSDFYNSLKSQIDYIIEGDPLVHSKADTFFNQIRSGITKSQLMVKPAILVKQLTSAPSFVEEIGAKEYGKAFMAVAANPKKWLPMVWKTEYVKNRMSNSQYADIQQQLDQRDNTLRGLGLGDYLMMNVRFGDIGAVVAGGAPIYAHAYSKAKDAGDSDTQAALKAEEAFGLASERAQQSSAGHSKGAFLRGNGLARTFFMYMTSPLQYQRNINTSIINLVANVVESKGGRKADTKKAATQALRAVLIYHVVLPQIFQAVASGLVGFTDDEDKILEQFWARQRRALYMGNLNTFPLIGNVISILLNKATGADEVFDSTGSPAVDLFTRTLKDVARAADNPDELKSWYKLAEDLSKPTGIPLETARKYLEAAEDISEGDAEHPIMRALGWSSWSLME